MSVQTFMAEFQDAIVAQKIVKTATCTLTDQEVKGNLRICGSHASAGIAFTLPTPGDANDGAFVIIENTGVAAVTVTADADSNGFGGASSGADTVTLSQGLSCLVYRSETYWQVIGGETIA